MMGRSRGKGGVVLFGLARRLKPVGHLLSFGADGSYLSLDIGSSSVKALEVVHEPSGPRVVDFVVAPLPPSAVQSNMIHDPDAVSAAIRELLGLRRVRARRVVTAVPGPAVIIKKLAVPLQRRSDLDDLVQAEAANVIPESLDNVNLDYQLLDASPTGEEVEVLLVAVRTEILNSYIGVIRDADLVPVVVDVDYFALENMYEFNYDVDLAEVVALVNIGARYSSINILRGDRSVFTGDVAVGGAELGETLTRNLGLTHEEVEVVTAGGTVKGLGRDEIDTLLGPVTGFLIDEIQRALSFFWRAASEGALSHVYLSGGTARLPGLSERLAERLEAPVELANPFRRLRIGRLVDAPALERVAPSLAVCAGLATRRPGDK